MTDCTTSWVEAFPSMPEIEVASAAFIFFTASLDTWDMTEPKSALPAAVEAAEVAAEEAAGAERGRQRGQGGGDERQGGDDHEFPFRRSMVMEIRSRDCLMTWRSAS